MTKTPDEIMEAAKQKAALKPNEQISVKLNETEFFTVTYSDKRDTFDCSRMIVGSSRFGKQKINNLKQ